MVTRGLLALTLSLLAGAAAAQPEVCRVSADITPRRAVVGQQILYRVRIERSSSVERVDWLRAPTFPDFRVEWLPGRAEESDQREDGTRYLAREEHRALFPARAGELVSPSVSIRCTLDDATSPADSIREASAPPLTLEVVAPPERGRPDDFTGLVGPVHLQLMATPRRVELGEAVHLSIGLRGPSNVWDQPPPIGDTTFAGRSPRVELFSSGVQLDLEPGERLYARRFFRFDLVPRERGRLHIPALGVSYYDPRRGEYASARTSPVDVEVVAMAAAMADTTAPAAPAPRDSATRAVPRAWLHAPAADSPFLVPGIVLGALILGLFGWQLRDRRRRRWQAVRQALVKADFAAATAGPREEAAALEDALRAALRCLAPEFAELDSQQMVQSANEGELVERIGQQLRDLERIQFGTKATPPDRGTIERLLSSARSAPTSLR